MEISARLCLMSLNLGSSCEARELSMLPETLGDSCQMKDTVNILKEFTEERRVGNASLDESNVTVSYNRLDISSPPGGEVIKDYYLVPTLQ